MPGVVGAIIRQDSRMLKSPCGTQHPKLGSSCMNGNCKISKSERRERSLASAFRGKILFKTACVSAVQIKFRNFAPKSLVRDLSYSQVIKAKTEEVITIPYDVPTVVSKRSVMSRELCSLGNFSMYKERISIIQQEISLKKIQRELNREKRKQRSERKFASRHDPRSNSNFLVGVETNPGWDRVQAAHFCAPSDKICKKITYGPNHPVISFNIPQSCEDFYNNHLQDFDDLAAVCNRVLLNMSNYSPDMDEQTQRSFEAYARLIAEIEIRLSGSWYSALQLIHDVETNPGESVTFVFDFFGVDVILNGGFVPNANQCVLIENIKWHLNRSYDRTLRRRPRDPVDLLRMEHSKRILGVPVHVDLSGLLVEQGIEPNPGWRVREIIRPVHRYWRKPQLDDWVSPPKDVNFSRPIDREFLRLQFLTTIKDRSYGFTRSQRCVMDSWKPFVEHPRTFNAFDYIDWVEPHVLARIKFPEGPYLLPKRVYETFDNPSPIRAQMMKVGLDDSTKQFLKEGIPVRFPDMPKIPDFGFEGNNVLNFIMTNKDLGILVFSALAVALAYDRIESKVLRAILVVAEVVLALHLSTSIALPFIRKIMDLMNGHELPVTTGGVIKAQAQLSSSDIVDILGTCVCGGLFATATHKSVSTADAAHVFRSFGDMGRVKQGVTSLVDFVISVIKKFANWLDGSEKLKGIEIFEDRYPGFGKSAKAVNDFIERMRTDPTYNYANGQDCFALEREINNIINTIPVNDAGLAPYRAEAYRLHARLAPLINCFASENLTSSSRKLPTCVWVSGDSGVGKSSMLKKMITECYGAVASDTRWAIYKMKPSDQVYAYDYTRDFWDSYHGQFVTIVDEAGLMREVAGATNDGFMSIIRMINVFDFPLNMADLPKKGKTYFCSEFVFVTSNREHINDIKSLYYPDAYINRMQLAYHQVVKREYATEQTKDLRPWSRKVNRSLIPDTEDETLNFDWVEYIPVDLRTGIQSGPILQFQEACDQIVAKYHENDSFGERALKSYDADIRAVDAKREARKKYTTDPKKLSSGDFHYDFSSVLPKTESFEDRLLKLNQEREIMRAKAKLDKCRPPQSAIDDHDARMAKLVQDIKDSKEFIKSAPTSDKEDGAPIEAEAEHEDLDEWYHTDNDSSSEEDEDIPPHLLPGWIPPPPPPMNGGQRQVGLGIIEWIQARYQPSVERSINNVIGDRLLEAGMRLKERSRPMADRLDISDDPYDCETDAVSHIVDFGKLPKWYLICVAKAYQFNIEVFIKWARECECKFFGDAPMPVQLATKFNQEFITKKGSFFAEIWTVVYNGVTAKGIVAGLLTGVALMTSFYLLVKLFSDKKEPDNKQYIFESGTWDTPTDDPDAESYVDAFNRKWFAQSGKAKGKKAKRARPSNRLRKIGKPLDAQMFRSDRNGEDKMFSVVRHNQYLVSFNETYAGFVTFFVGNLAFMPMHFYDAFMTAAEIDPTVEMTLIPCDGSTPITRRVLDWFDEDSCSVTTSDERVGDYVFMNIPKMRPHADIISHFVTDDDPILDEVHFAQVLRYFTGPKSDVYRSKPASMKPCADIRYPDDCGGAYVCSRAFAITVPTRDGDCGALYWTADSSKVVSKITAMHVSGDGLVGFGVAITSNLLRHVAADFKTPPTEVDAVPFIAEMDNPKFKQGCGMSQFRVLTTTKPLYNAAKNNVVPSVLHSRWGESEYVAAPVQQKVVNGVMIDPLEPSRSKINKNDKSMNDLLYRECMDSYVSACLACSEPAFYGKTTVPWEDAICGREAVWSGIPLSSSPGYPFTEGNKSSGKKYWFGGPDGYDLSKPAALEMIAHLEGLESVMLSGVRPMFIFKDSPKVERRKKGKACRQINASPMDYFVLCRKYFGAFVVWFMANVLKNGSAMGINPFGEQWDVLARTLQRFSQAMAGDYSAWDGSLTPQMMEAICVFIRRFYGDEDPEANAIRDILLLDLIYSRHIVTITTPDTVISHEIEVDMDIDYIDIDLPEGQTYTSYVIEKKLAPGNYRVSQVGEVDVFMITVIYEWKGAMPSGHFLTTVGNIIVNNCVLRYAFADQILGGEAMSYTVLSPSPLRFIEDNFWMCCFGDDNVIAMTPQGAELVSQDGTTLSLAKIGLKYTDENKGTGSVGIRKFTEVSFLKRGFRYERMLGRFVAPLELGVILEMPYWTKTNEQPGAFAQTCRTCVLELALHGRQVFNQWFPILEAGFIFAQVLPPECVWEAALRAAAHLEASHL
jgi:hypothetical protein